jgi:hypothetical protein
MDSTRSSSDYRFWKRCTIALGVLVVFLLAAISYLWSLACLDLGSHTNLYYRLWKVGVRPFEAPVALGGLYDDSKHQAKLIGISKAEFDKLFPDTFFEFRNPPLGAKPGQRWFVQSYAASVGSPGASWGWVAIFENNVLIEFALSEA